MHLSKVKHSKFNESGQLLAFYGASAVWGADIIIKVSAYRGVELVTPVFSKTYVKPMGLLDRLSIDFHH